MANSWRYRNPIRIGFQLVVLGLIGYVAIRPLFGGGYVADFEAYCPFGGLSSFMSRLNKGTMSCTMSEVQVMLGFGLLLGVLVIGKLFCSYLCPIGSITEWLGKSAWSDRAIALLEDIWQYADIQTPFGNMATANFEVNGDLLQACSASLPGHRSGKGSRDDCRSACGEDQSDPEAA